MSESKTDIAMRYKIGVATTVEEAIKVVSTIFGNPEDESEFYFNPKGNFKVAWIDNQVFLDYYIIDGEECYCDLYFSLDIEVGLEVAEAFTTTFTEYENDYIMNCIDNFEDESKLRILQYYNGGCSGLAEVV